MYKCTCKKCCHEWETKECDCLCPNCGAEGKSLIGFAYIHSEHEHEHEPEPEPEPEPEDSDDSSGQTYLDLS